jgi:hypothetical protein
MILEELMRMEHAESNKNRVDDKNNAVPCQTKEN